MRLFSIVSFLALTFIFMSGAEAEDQHSCDWPKISKIGKSSSAYSLAGIFASLKVADKGRFEPSRSYYQRLGDSHWRAKMVGDVYAVDGVIDAGTYNADTETYTFDMSSIADSMVDINDDRYRGVYTGESDEITVQLNVGRLGSDRFEDRKYFRQGMILITDCCAAKTIKFRLPFRQAKDALQHMEFVLAGRPSSPFELEEEVSHPSLIPNLYGQRPHVSEYIKGIVVAGECVLLRDQKSHKIYAAVEL